MADNKATGNFVNTQWMPGPRLRPPASGSLGGGRVGRGGVKALMIFLPGQGGAPLPYKVSAHHVSLIKPGSHQRPHQRGAPKRLACPLLLMTQPKHFSPAPCTCLGPLWKVNLSICQYLLCLLPSTEEGKTVFTVKLVFIQRICRPSQSYGKSSTPS